MILIAKMEANSPDNAQKPSLYFRPSTASGLFILSLPVMQSQIFFTIESIAIFLANLAYLIKLSEFG